MIGDGLQFMVIGMTVVFCFLVLLVYVVQAVSALIINYFPEQQEPAAEAQNSSTDKAKIAAAIAIAISKS